MQNEQFLVTQVLILGFPVNLIGQYVPGKQLMLVLDAEEPAQKVARKATKKAIEKPGTTVTKPDAEQASLREFVGKRLANDQSLFNQLKAKLKAKDEYSILDAFTEIRFNDVAIKYDLKKKQTLVHFELYMGLKVSIKELSLKIHYLCLDFTYGSGADAFKDEKTVKAFKEEIAEAKKATKGGIKWNQLLGDATSAVSDTEKALKGVEEALGGLGKLDDVAKEMQQTDDDLNSALRSMDTSEELETATQTFGDQQRALEKATQNMEVQETTLQAATKSLEQNENAMASALEGVERLDTIEAASANQFKIDQLLDGSGWLENDKSKKVIDGLDGPDAELQKLIDAMNKKQE